MIDWTPMTAPPETPGLYLVFAPSEDNVINPFIRVSWWGVSGWTSHDPTWVELPSGWREAVTHWAVINLPKARRLRFRDEHGEAVAKMYEDGLSGGQIAKRLGVSVPTVYDALKARNIRRRQRKVLSQSERDARYLLAAELRQSGKTFRVIGAILGVSAMRASQLAKVGQRKLDRARRAAVADPSEL